MKQKTSRVTVRLLRLQAGEDVKFAKTAASLAIAASALTGVATMAASSANAATANIPQAVMGCEMTLYQGQPAQWLSDNYGTSVNIVASDVKVLQTQINRFYASKGWKTRIAVDGVFGSGTRTAVITTQRALGLDADGVAGPATLNALRIVPGECA